MYHIRIETGRPPGVPGQPVRHDVTWKGRAGHEQARQAAGRDPQLARMWQQLFDDADP